jgi:hypothetical protein
MTGIAPSNSSPTEKSETRAEEAQVSGSIYCIYFYYLHFPAEADEPDRADIYEAFDIDDAIEDQAELMSRIKRLTLNAITNGKNPPRYAESIKDLNMDRQSYYVVVADSPDKKFAAAGGIKFEGKNHNDKVTDGTHTFGNELYLEYDVTLADGTKRDLTGACYVNILHGKKDNGNSERLKKGEWECFKIDLKFQNKRLRLVDDSGGTNMGPPVPPPSRLKARHEKGA